MLHGLSGHQSQLRLCHCCTCTASFEARPLMAQEVPAVGLPITCDSDRALQQFKGISITISTPGPFRPGHSVKCCDELIHEPQSLQSSAYCVMDLSTATDASRSIRSGVGLPTGHSFFRCVKNAAAWTYPQPQLLQGAPGLLRPFPLATIPSEIPADTCRVVVLSTDRCFEVFWHGLTHRHGHCKVFLLQQGLLHGHRCFKRLCSPTWTHSQVAVPPT